MEQFDLLRFLVGVLEGMRLRYFVTGSTTTIFYGDSDLGRIAAGPIEGFLGWHGTAWIDRVEAEALRDRKFARAITGVWKYLMKEELWGRVKAIKSFAPTEEWLPAGRQELAHRSPK